jgi:hypothetical protein
MARLQPNLSDSETALVDQVATLTRSRRTDVLRNALTVYSWIVRQSATGSRVFARKPSGEEVAFETAELASLEASSQLLSPMELGLLAKKLARAKDEREATRLRERLTRGFYGI